MAVKFEEQFKHRDESNVNAQCGTTRWNRKSLCFSETFLIPRNSVYCRAWQTGNHRQSRAGPAAQNAHRGEPAVTAVAATIQTMGKQQHRG
jgi:hypothetical protein